MQYYSVPKYKLVDWHWKKKIEIPMDWYRVKIEHIITILPGFPADSLLFDKKKGIPLIRIRDLPDENTEVCYNGPYERQYNVKNGDMLVGMDGGFRPYLWKGQNALLNQRICKITTSDKSILDQRYLYYSISKELKFYELINVGTTVPHISKFDIEDIYINKPPIQEQQKIGLILSNVDKLIQKIDQIIEHTKKLKRGLMQKLLTKGIGHSDFKIVRMGFRYMLEKYPQEWKIVPLVELGKIERGKFAHRPRDDPEYYGGKYPFIQTGDIEGSNGYIMSFSQTLNEKGLSVSKMFPSGIIAITIAANIGSVAITTFPLCFPDSIVGISTSKIDLQFLYYFLQTRKRFLEISATVSAQPNINLETLRPLLIAVPPLDEQQKIVSILSETDSSIQLQKEYKSKLYDVKTGLMQKLLTGKIRIKL